MSIESSFPLLLGCGHGFVDVDAAPVQHVELDAGFGAFSVGERRAGLVLSHEQFDHDLVGNEFVFKGALLFLLTACDLGAKRLDGGASLFKGLASRDELVEGAIRLACLVLSAPELNRITELFSKNCDTAGEI